MPDRMSDRMPENMSHGMPNRMPDRMSKGMPGRRSEPDRRSERMPDDQGPKHLFMCLVKLVSYVCPA